jgi:hypothetical protein
VGREAGEMGMDGLEHGLFVDTEFAANKQMLLEQLPGKTSGRCPGYVVDHVKALECGGVDEPSNMQWQTIAAGKAKDKTERNCRP